MRTEDITCPGCGEPWSLDMTTCPSCMRPVIITTFNGVGSLTPQEANGYLRNYDAVDAQGQATGATHAAKGFIYLKLRLYPQAIAAFDKAIDDYTDNSEAYFFAAVATLKGKTPFVCSRQDIERAESLLNAASMIEPRGIYSYFLAYLKYDFYLRKFLNTTPSAQDCLNRAVALGYSNADRIQLFEALGTDDPFV